MVDLNGKWVHYAVDESNHGREPEFFAAVSSKNLEDIEIYFDSKRIDNKENLFRELYKRDFRFTIVRREHYFKYGYHDLIAHVTLSLFQGFPLKKEFNSNYLMFHIDGELKEKQKSLIRYLVSESTKIPSNHIEIRAVPKSTRKDKSNNLIKLADSFSNFLYKNYFKDLFMRERLQDKLVLFD